jgi:hypothetical protein
MQDATPLPAMVLKDLQKYYPPPRTGIRAYVQPFERATRPALQGVTFEVQEGEAVAWLGANVYFWRDLMIAKTYRIPFVMDAMQALFGATKFFYAVRFVDSPQLRSELPRPGGYFAFALVGYCCSSAATPPNGCSSACGHCWWKAFSSDHPFRLAAADSYAESHDSRAECHARGTSWRSWSATITSSHRTFAALRDRTAPLSMLVFYWTLERTKATGTLSHR